MSDALCTISVDDLSSAVTHLVNSVTSNDGDPCTVNNKKSKRTRKASTSSNSVVADKCKITGITFVNSATGLPKLPIPRLPKQTEAPNPSIQHSEPLMICKESSADGTTSTSSGNLNFLSASHSESHPLTYDNSTYTLAYNSASQHLTLTPAADLNTVIVSQHEVSGPDVDALNYNPNNSSSEIHDVGEIVSSSDTTLDHNILPVDNGLQTLTQDDNRVIEEVTYHIMQDAATSEDDTTVTSVVDLGISKENSLVSLQNLVLSHLSQTNTQLNDPTVTPPTMTGQPITSDCRDETNTATTVIELLHVVDESRDGQPETSHSSVHTNTVIMSAYCIECNKVWPSGCPLHIHTYTHIPDAPLLSRARASLPSQLRLRSLDGSHSPDFIGIVASTAIAARTVFGPLEGKRTSKEQLERPGDTAYVWELTLQEKSDKVLDCRHEDHSNWLMFVKRARWSHEQNLVAYQHGEDIYFVTRRDINAEEELLYWYSSDYAQKLGVAESPELLFPCAKCKSAYSSVAALHRHDLRAHPDTSSRKHTCNVCSKSFITASKLRQHSVTHSGHKAHKCTVCGKTFNVASNLRVHMRTHNNDRRYECEQCGKTFQQKSHLSVHLLIHTGEKRYKCDYCDRMFARAGDRTLHHNTHTNNKQYTCKICQKSFYKDQNLKRHEKIHTDERDFPCTQCSAKFYNKYHLNRHLKSCKGRT